MRIDQCDKLLNTVFIIGKEILQVYLVEISIADKPILNERTLIQQMEVVEMWLRTSDVPLKT
jgi:hypothetical protein